MGAFGSDSSSSSTSNVSTTSGSGITSQGKGAVNTGTLTNAKTSTTNKISTNANTDSNNKTTVNKGGTINYTTTVAAPADSSSGSGLADILAAFKGGGGLSGGSTNISVLPPQSTVSTLASAANTKWIIWAASAAVALGIYLVFFKKKP